MTPLEITVTKNSDITLLTPIDGVANEENLIVKAARLLQEKSCQKNKRETSRLGANISIKKILPMGGGLRWWLIKCRYNISGPQYTMAM